MSLSSLRHIQQAIILRYILSWQKQWWLQVPEDLRDLHFGPDFNPVLLVWKSTASLFCPHTGILVSFSKGLEMKK